MAENAGNDGRRDELDDRPLKRARVADEVEGGTHENDGDEDKDALPDSEGEDDEGTIGIPEPSRASDLYLDTV